MFQDSLRKSTCCLYDMKLNFFVVKYPIYVKPEDQNYNDTHEKYDGFGRKDKR